MPVVHSDPFRGLDRMVAQALWGSHGPRTLAIPMDAHRKGNAFEILLDLPGVDAEGIDLTVEDNVLTVRVERAASQVDDPADVLVAERPHGVFTRQVFLGDNLDTEHIEAVYEAGVLCLSIPVAAHAKSRRIEVARRDVKSNVKNAVQT